MTTERLDFKHQNFLPQLRQFFSILFAPLWPHSRPKGPNNKAPQQASLALKPFLEMKILFDPHLGHNNIDPLLDGGIVCVVSFCML